MRSEFGRQKSQNSISSGLPRWMMLACRPATFAQGSPVGNSGATIVCADADYLATCDAIRARLVANLAWLRTKVAGTALTLLDVEGGWYATLRLPRVESEEAWSLLFLERDGVYVHPGHFFDFSEEAYVVVSLLTPEASFAEGVTRLVLRVENRIADVARTVSSG